MAIKVSNEYGEITIAESVVKELVVKSIEEFLERVFGKAPKDLAKVVKISENDDDSINISFKVKAKYGENVEKFGRDLQSKIKDDIERMTEIVVRRIDLTITGFEEELLKRLEEEQEEKLEEIEGEKEMEEHVEEEMEKLEETTEEEKEMESEEEIKEEGEYEEGEKKEKPEE